MTRECGTCSQCCFTCDIEDLKPSHSRCPHQSKVGCGIYADRPMPCAAYSCAWREGIIPKKGFRPDEFVCIEGYAIEFLKPTDGFQAGDRVHVLMAYFGNRPVRKQDTARLKQLVNGTRCVLVNCRNEMSMIATTNKHRAAAEIVLGANQEAFRSSGRDTRTAVDHSGRYAICQLAGSNPATMTDTRNEFPEFFEV